MAGMALLPGVVRAADRATSHPTDSLLSDQGDNVQGDADLQNRLTLETMIDGKGPFHFVVDTGADRSVISTELAASLGLINDESVIVQGIARALPAETVMLQNIAFGPVEMSKLPVPMLPRKWLHTDGYLGLDVIDGRKVTFDFQNHRIWFGRPMSEWDYAPKFMGSSEIVIRVDGSHGRLKAFNCAVDGVPVTAFIDSGAQATIGNSALFAGLAKNGAVFTKNAVVPLLGATGGEILGRVTNFDNIKFDTLNFNKSNLIIADLDVFNVWGLADKPALFIGMNFLQLMSSFTIDYRRKELHFKLAEEDYQRLARA
jgi:predicted aspartyl protease